MQRSRGQRPLLLEDVGHSTVQKLLAEYSRNISQVAVGGQRAEHPVIELWLKSRVLTLAGTLS